MEQSLDIISPMILILLLVHLYLDLMKKVLTLPLFAQNLLLNRALYRKNFQLGRNNRTVPNFV